MMKFILFLLLLPTLLFAQDLSEVQKLLDIDRFHAYSQSWSGTMHGRGKDGIAGAVNKLTPGEISQLGIDPKRFSDAFNYDDIILEILTKKHPELKATKVDVEWGYNFLKRKLNDSYKIDAPKNFPDPKTAPVVEIGKPAGSALEITAAASEDVLLNVDSYVASRTTRGIFWEASHSNRKIELHVGTASDFRADLEQRGAKVLGFVNTHGNNYNPIYIVQNPGEAGFHYAVTEISGADRLKHFQMQIGLVRWPQEGNKLFSPPPVEVIGDPFARLASEEKQLTQIMKGLPKADHVLVGQKGAFERTIGSLGKLDGVLALQQSHPNELSVLSPAHQKLIERAKTAESSQTFVMKYASDLDKIHEALKPAYEKHNINVVTSGSVYNLDRGMYEVSDYMMTGADGKPQRWRVFSNVWGDEVLPIANSLKATGHTDIMYMGTAGSFQGSGLKVGDLVVPKKSEDVHGMVRDVNTRLVPPGSKYTDQVTHVSSPFEETKDWLKAKQVHSQIVEVETGYLSKVFSGPNDKLSVMLLVSDVVGSEGETLAEASSSIRRNAQIAGLTAVLDSSKAMKPAATTFAVDDISKWINELEPNRDPLSKFQVFKTAEASGISTKAEVAALLKSQKSFTGKRVLGGLEQADARLAAFLDHVMEAGYRPTISVEKAFLEGRWNPAVGPINVHLEVSDPEINKKIQALITEFKTKDKTFAKNIGLTVSAQAADSQWLKLPGFLDNMEGTLTNLYKDTALGFGGFATTETRNGALKFVQVGPHQKGKAVPQVAFFKPDAESNELLKKFKSDPQAVEDFLKLQAMQLNESMGNNKNWEVRVNKVSTLPGGAQASITPGLTEDKLIINVNVTPEGLNNPAVALEESIHLKQITGAADPGTYTAKMSAFVHPYEWAETMANAQAGSPRAMEKIARLEVDAAKSAKDYLGTLPDNFFGAAQELNIDLYLNKRTAHAERIYVDVAKLAKQDMRNRDKAWDKMKEIFSKAEGEGLKFNDYVLKNDRKNAAALLNKYIPWDIMEPSEISAWKTWVEAIEKPSKTEKTLVFRGLDDDVLLKPETGKPGIFSTVLSKTKVTILADFVRLRR